MIFLFHGVICLGLILIETTFVPQWPQFQRFYDFLALYVLYLGLFRKVREGLPMTLTAGFLMDALCGGAFGIYLTAYFWLYLGVRWSTNFLHAGNTFLLPLWAGAGILFENVMFLGILALSGDIDRFSGEFLHSVIIQVLGAFFTGPFLLAGFDCLLRKKDRWHARLSGDAAG